VQARWTGKEKPDLVNDQRLGIATKCGKHASAEVEEEDEGSARDPYGLEQLEGVHSEDLVREVYVPNVELTVSTWSEVTGLALVFEPPGGKPDVVYGVRGSWGGVVRVRGKHPVPAEE
jgi:hypothetical protein